VPAPALISGDFKIVNSFRVKAPPSRRTAILRLVTAVAIASASACAWAATDDAGSYPDRAVTLLVGYPPGGAIDQSARLVAQALSERWGQPVVVENRAGANGTIAATRVATAKPDGYTLLVTATSHTLNGLVMKKLPYDTQTGFTPVALIVDVPNVLVVNAASPYQTLSDLVTTMRTKQPPLSYASQGVGGIPHVAGELFALRTGAPLNHVPYKGANQGLADLVAGFVDMSFPSPASAMPHLRSGKLRALAVSAPERFQLLQDVPTFAEAGIAEFTVGTWHGLLAPAGTPESVVARINADINAIISSAAFHDSLVAQGNMPAARVTPQAFAERLSRERRMFEPLAKTLAVD
jgi:tripartite-type tricarboxylate transporter receptor subunit TctC